MNLVYIIYSTYCGNRYFVPKSFRKVKLMRNSELSRNMLFKLFSHVEYVS